MPVSRRKGQQMGKETILVIEDNEFNMKLVRTLLQFREYHVLEAIDAETGIKLARERIPSMILMDIQLPGMDGLEATRLIRRDQKLKRIPVVALTSYAMRGDEDRALKAGCTGYITKPIDTRKFLTTLEGYKGDAGGEAAGTEKEAYRHRILIVDDDSLNTKLLVSMLPKEKYAVITGSNGEMCLQKALNDHPDLILLDVMMPGTDGYEVTRRLKTDPRTKHIPVMLITALDGKSDKIKGLEAGADDFLNKPVNTYELRARVQSLLRMKVYHDQLKTRSQTKNFVLKPGNQDHVEIEAASLPSILLVEDNPGDVRLFQQYLGKEAFRLNVAVNGEEAVAFAREEPIDLVLLDILLPGMDGFEVAGQIKKMSQHKNIQLVVVTVLDDMNNKIRGIHLGADDYLIKPVNRVELVARVQSLLKKKAYMDQLSLQFETALQAAISDKLTGVYNHAYLKHFLDLEVKRSMRQNHPLALIMIDIDDFKKYNDTHGHPAGDTLLNWMGRVIRKNIREVDVPARYGGEEFAVVLPYADRKGAASAADRILEAIRTDSFPASDSRPEPGSEESKRVTVSMGVALYPEDAESAQELIKLADKALYRAKREGKNRVCLHGENAGSAAGDSGQIPPEVEKKEYVFPHNGTGVR
ncbi:MAG: response regulator [Desulfobacteraceae bacterium]|nr:MAG: response regulator [Desulfobacteraceae bacterium]